MDTRTTIYAEMLNYDKDQLRTAYRFSRMILLASQSRAVRSYALDCMAVSRKVLCHYRNGVKGLSSSIRRVKSNAA